MSLLPLTSTLFPYTTLFRSRFDSDQGDGRVDYNFSDALHFFGRYTIADFNKFAPGAYGTIAGGPGLDQIFFAGTSLDRKSTRLNSSHRTISYAVFCLKKKKL